MVGHLTYLSDESLGQRFGRKLQERDQFEYDFSHEFEVESYLDYKGRQFAEQFDANAYLYITKAMDYYDLNGRAGGLAAAFGPSHAKFLLVSFTSDWLYPSRPVEGDRQRPHAGRQRRLLRGDRQPARPRLVPDRNRAADAHHQFVPGQREAAPAMSAQQSARPHIDYDEIVKLVPPGSSVLDLGCGDGELLHRLIAAKQVRGRGVDIQESMIIESISKGISVFQGDLDEGLRDYATGSYEYVILNQTLQATHRPLLVLEEMLRVGKHAIVSFPNFGYYRVRLQFLFSGRMPVTRDLPYMWHNTPNIHLCTRKDFLDYCTGRGVTILNEIAIAKRGTISPLLANWRATEVLFVLSGTRPRNGAEGAEHPL